MPRSPSCRGTRSPSIDTPDDLTAVVTFKAGAANWFEPFTGTTNGNLIAAHAFNNEPKLENNPDYLLKPLGTGAFVISEFVPNDRATLTMNENYRDPSKPFFSSLNVKGGGDAPSAARSVLETGDYHYAWNLQVEPAILLQMANVSELGQDAEDRPGNLRSIVGTRVERIHINFSDPNTEVDGQRSEMNTPHPFLSDPAVRQALNKAIPRQLIVDEFYGLASRTSPNILTGIPDLESPNTSWEYNLEAAAQILDEAGWTVNGDVREKDGVQIEINYGTSINQVRQKTQAVVKQALEELNIKVILDQVDSGTFFDSGAGNERNVSHNYWDISMYTNNPSSPVPASWFNSWYAGEGGVNIAQKSNGWSGRELPALQQPRVRRALRQPGRGTRPGSRGPDLHPDERRDDQRRGGDPGGQSAVGHLRDLQAVDRRERRPRCRLRGDLLEHRQLAVQGRIGRIPPERQTGRGAILAPFAVVPGCRRSIRERTTVPRSSWLRTARIARGGYVRISTLGFAAVSPVAVDWMGSMAIRA